MSPAQKDKTIIYINEFGFGLIKFSIFTLKDKNISSEVEVTDSKMYF